MKRITAFKADDGKLFESEQLCLTYEREVIEVKALKDLIDNVIQYSDNNKMVFDFINSNKEALRTILK
jgi:hypothetical protein